MSSDADPTLMTFTGVTLSGITSALLSLNSDMIYGSISSLTLPKGLQAKIWGIRIGGSQIVVAVNFAKTYSGILVSSVPHDVFAYSPTSGVPLAPLVIEKNRPILIPGLAGGETINVAYSMTSAAPPCNIGLDIELSEI